MPAEKSDFKVCVNCTKEGRKKLGFICDFETNDGLPVRCCHPQTFEKLRILRYYLEIVTNSMKDKHGHLNYVDLFCGSGICRDRESREEKLGSALSALSLKNGFTNYVFNDLDRDTTDILHKRCVARMPSRVKSVTILNEDANTSIDKILSKVPKTNSLSIIFVDPNGLDIHWNTLVKLSKYQRLDIIINYGVSDFKRNKPTYERQNQKADKFFPFDWQNIKDDSALFSKYKDALKNIGLEYVEDNTEGSSVIKTSSNAPIYYLVFASKHPLGLNFWRAAKKKYRTPDLFSN